MGEQLLQPVDQIGLLNSLVISAEELIFKCPVPSDKLQSYETQRNKIYSQLGLSLSKNMRKLQREAYSKSSSTVETSTQINMYSELEKIHQLKLIETEQTIEGVKWETVQKIQKGSQVVEEYYNLCVVLLVFIDNINASLNRLAGVDNQTKKDDSYFKNDLDFIVEFRDDYESMLIDIKNLQNLQLEKASELKNTFKHQEGNFLQIFELIDGELNHRDFNIRTLLRKVEENEQKYKAEISEYRVKTKEFEGMIKKNVADEKERLLREIESLKREAKANEELLAKKHYVEIQEIFQENEKLKKRFNKVCEEQEFSQEKYSDIIHQYKIELQEISSEKLLLLNQIDKSNIHTESLQDELKDSRQKNKGSLATIERQQNENFLLKNQIKDLEEQFDREIRNNETKYKQIIETISLENEKTIKNFEGKILHLEDLLENKTNEIREFYKRFDQLSGEKHKFIQEKGQKYYEIQELTERLDNLSNQNFSLTQKYEDCCKQLDEIESISKKYFLMIKKKNEEEKQNYFNELILILPQLINDKEWLIEKLAEVSSTRKPHKRNRIEVSNKTHSNEFYSASVNSFKALKLFEKSRSDALGKFSNHPE